MNQVNLNQINNELKKFCPEKDQYFFGHGKLLITGEYFVLDGALSLALPTKFGQSLSVKYTPSFSPKLTWRSIDVDGKVWLESEYEFWHFKCLSPNASEEAKFLTKILQQVRKQNPHFLRDEVDVTVETRLGFPLFWGLGSSSSLIYNIAQWAYVSPFELLFKTHGGSGYDIACAQSDGPIAYKKLGTGPNWSPIYFNPPFKDNLYFVYQGKKQNSRDAIKEYNKKRPIDSQEIAKITELTQKFISSTDLNEFKRLIDEHEEILSSTLGMPKVKEQRFSDFNGSIKSLGAWGGDFVMVATDLNYKEVKEYFAKHELYTVYRYSDLISDPVNSISSDSIKMGFSNHLLH